MRIIRQGLTSAEWTQEVTCGGVGRSGCGAVLEVSLSDLYTEALHDIGGRRTSACCHCPSCGERIEIGGPTSFVTHLPTREEWEAAHPDLVRSLQEARDKARAMTQAAEAKYPRGRW